MMFVPGGPWSCSPSRLLHSLSLAASLRAELNHLHATAIEHLKQIQLKENTVAKRELEKAMEHSHQQVTLMDVCSVFFDLFQRLGEL